MGLKGLMNLEIRKGKRKVFFWNEPIKDENHLDKNKFIEFIENHLDFFSWDENDFDKSIAKSHLVPKKTYYRFRTIFHSPDRIIIDQTAPAKMTIDILEILMELAESCNAQLFKTATKQVTRDFIESEKQKIITKKELKEKRMT